MGQPGRVVPGWISHRGPLWDIGGTDTVEAMKTDRPDELRSEEQALAGPDPRVDGRFDAARERGRALMAAWEAEDLEREPAAVIDLREQAERRPARRRFLGRVKA